MAGGAPKEALVLTEEERVSWSVGGEDRRRRNVWPCERGSCWRVPTVTAIRLLPSNSTCRCRPSESGENAFFNGGWMG